MDLTPPLDDSTLAGLISGLADAVVVADAAGTICFWNAAAERTFGWSADEGRRRLARPHHPGAPARAALGGLSRGDGDGRHEYGSDLLRVPSLHSDGERHSIAFTVTLLKDADGAVAGIAAVVRDETQRWTEEQDLRRRLRAAEDAPS